MSSQKHLPNLIMGALTISVIVLGILLFISPPALFVDPAVGFKAMRSMEMGGAFNTIITPNPDDLTKNSSQFLTWWSPGQYLLPYAFKLLLGVNTGKATALTITLCQLLGLWGFYAFFKKIGFSPIIAALSLLFIACQQFFIQPYVFYYGGEQLLFGFLGWFFYGCVKFDKPGPMLVLFVLLSGLIGFFCKSSVMWMYSAGLLFLWIRLSSKKPLVNWIKNGLWIGIPAVVSILLIWLFFLSKGDNPASISSGFKFTLKAICFPLASPMLAGFSADDLSHGLIYHTEKVIFPGVWAIIVLLVLTELSLWLIISVLKRVPNKEYKLLILIFYISAILFFGYAYLKQMLISYEARHFRIIGLIVIPGVIYLISQTKPLYRTLFNLVWAGIAVSSIMYVASGYTKNKTQAAYGTSGVAQRGFDQKSLNQVISLDNQNRNAIFVFVDESVSLEIRHNRVITLRPIGDDLKIDYDDYEQGGHTGPLFIILPESYAGPKEKLILKCFPDYNGWQGSMLSDKCVMYAAK